MSNLFYRNPRLLLLSICLIAVSGLSSFYLLPRMEDPELTERAANINTVFPGADATRVESLVTDKLEQALRDIEEIKEIRSRSVAGISTIAVELRDDVYEVDTVWSRVRDKLDDTRPELPTGALEPEFDQAEVKAHALILALTWDLDPRANYAILRRLAEELEDSLRAVPGTENVELYGDPDEEYLVEVEPERVAALRLTVDEIAAQLQASDAKQAAGQLRSRRGDLLLDVDAELDAAARIGRTPIRHGAEGAFTQLADVATIRKGIVEPPSSLAIVSGRPAVVVGAFVRSDCRLDHWSHDAGQVLANFEGTLPRGVSLRRLFEQSGYVDARLEDLLRNLLAGGAAVVLVVLVLMGWRSAVVVAAALPLSALMVLSGLRLLEIPIHQMSVTGLILALGLLIDNAIVIVDEVRERLRGGDAAARAVSESVRHLAVPLFGSTFTTALAFGPIAFMPGPAGEFVGSIAVSVILAIGSSFLLALTVTPALTGLLLSGSPGQVATAGGSFRPRRVASRIRGAGPARRVAWWRDGLSVPWVTAAYRRSLGLAFRRPLLGIAVGLILPVAGFVQARRLPEQFFPPADRDQFYIEAELPPQGSLAESRRLVQAVRDRALRDPHVADVHWFLGESAPSFYYNLIARRKNSPRYAQGLVQLASNEQSRRTIQRLQQALDSAFPGARILVRQLEQGPPFDAPIELRVYGPDLERLRELGDDLRRLLAGTPDVIHTRAELSESLPKLALAVDEEQARLAGLDHGRIARQLDLNLEGVTGGSVLEATEELPVRVRIGSTARGDLERVASLDLLAGPSGSPAVSPKGYRGVPLSSVSRITLGTEVAAIPRFNGRRMNEVQAFVTAGVLPSEVLGRFRRRLEAANWEPPRGYWYELGGESAKRNDAVGNLLANVGVLLVLMAASLVLSFRSFRVAGLVACVGLLSVGLGLGALWIFGYPFGFMAIVGTMGLVGVAINDTIVVLAALRADPHARRGRPQAVRRVVLRSSRHVLATSLTTMAGFAPLVMGGGGFWPPLAVAIAGGVGGATILALYFAPAAYVLLVKRADVRRIIGGVGPATSFRRAACRDGLPGG